MGTDRVIAVDLHSGQIQGFFDPTCPVDNIRPYKFIMGALLTKIPELIDSENVCVVSPDAGGVARVKAFKENLDSRRQSWKSRIKTTNEGKSFEDFNKEDDEDEKAPEETNPSSTNMAMIIKERDEGLNVEKMSVIGEISGKDVIIVDDIIDTAGTLCSAVTEMKNKGAKKVWVFASHAILSGPALERINNSNIDLIVVTDTVPLSDEAKKSPKIKQVSICVLLSEVIRRIHQKESLSPLYDINPVEKEDFR